MKITATICVMLAFVGSGSAEEKSEPLKIGDKGHPKFATLGCTNVETTERAIHLLLSGDNEAFIKYTLTRYANGECRPLNKEAVFTVEDIGVIHNAACVRVVGDPDCYWALQPLLTH